MGAIDTNSVIWDKEGSTLGKDYYKIIKRKSINNSLGIGQT
jgi:hypothetical protein